MDPTPAEPRVAPASSQPTWNDSLSQLDGYAEQLRVKLPLAPPGLLNGYMSVAPWVAIVFGVLGILISLVAVAGSTLIGTFVVLFGYPGTGLALLLNSLVGIVASALALIGGYLMLQRRLTGWWLLAVGIVVNLLSSLFHATILWLILLLLIGYVHLQVKPNYR